ncbi:MAG: double-strand break repair helicase AddA [Pseudomonadota bacterium]
MSVNEATRRQIQAARPDASTWLSANAGSGKTRVLTDRVARLLLGGVDPQNILCLTYTKAAASEMQNRLFKRLGAWAMMDDVALTQALSELGAPVAADLRRARTLFAAAIETPGGLKIQTIHSFCAGLLRRFPMEAGVSPNFKEIEDRASELLRADVVDALADGPERAAVAGFARLVTEENFEKLSREISVSAFIDLSRDDALELLGLRAGLTEDQVFDDVFQPGTIEAVQGLIPHLEAKGGNDAKAALKLKDVTAPTQAALAILMDVLLFGEGAKSPFAAKIGSFPTAPTRKAAANLMPEIEALMERVEGSRTRLNGIRAAEATVALHAFGRRFNAAYAEAKRLRGWLDFDDLIEKARALLNDPKVAAWVLYRLDGGIDHILVDEAQDTSPAQWDVIRQLASEFGAGEGSREDVLRTIFVVGDKKQSIYSFQGADPREFDRMQAEFQARIEGADALFQSEELAFSFRSSPGILRLVDQCFEGAGTIDARHEAFKTELPGRVDLWPHEPPSEGAEEIDFRDPVDRTSPEHHHAILARRIAKEITRIIRDETIPDEMDGHIVRRKVEPRDFLILVQRRSGIFPQLIRALKAERLPIAGADRLKVGAELAVKDIAAVLAFLDVQDDDLSLATALRSPLFGWSEAALFDLAHGREQKVLWAELRRRRAEFPAEMEVLDDLRANADFLRPYDLIERILTRHGGRKKLLARLGPEAADGIDALLGQALDYEQSAVPSLTGFLSWLQTDDIEIKRQIDAASNQIRVMTVHGAKGLEAPIVILPDTAKIDIQVKDRIVELDGVPVWKPDAKAMPDALSERLREVKEDIWQEKLRLLYVALTRAEKWLIVAAAGKLDTTNGKSWFQIVQEAMGQLNAVPMPMPGGKGYRLGFDDWAGPPLVAPRAAGDRADAAPHVDHPLAHVPERRETLSPSGLEGAKALSGPDGMSEEDAKAYGTYVHAVLEGAAPRVDLAEELKDAAQQEAEAVLNDPALAHLFAADVLSEVTITADFGTERLHGKIDKLRVMPDTVTVVDFKTNRVLPTGPEDVPLGVLRQMGAYLHAIKKIYPDRRIKLAILWTRTRDLMVLPHDIVTASLSGLPYLDGAAGPS